MQGGHPTQRRKAARRNCRGGVLACQSTLKIEEIKTREQIAQTRACCKALGKDVQRYRNSAEAMHRRILQGKGLYQINNVVDTGNLISIKTGYSLGAYDVEKLEGDILWTATGEGVHYQGIGKDAVNIEFLPVLRDALGYFGNPNSDSTRAMITDKTTEILLCIILQRRWRPAAGAGRRLPRPCCSLSGAGCAGLGGGVAPRKVAFCRKMW